MYGIAPALQSSIDACKGIFRSSHTFGVADAHTISTRKVVPSIVVPFGEARVIQPQTGPLVKPVCYSAGMKTVYLVRHGEAEVNLESSEAFGGAESPLTERGMHQARLIAERAARLSAEALIASSMRRAQETAQRIAEATGLSIETSDLFVEARRPASTVGKRKDDPAARATADAWDRSMHHGGERIEDGETMGDLLDRAQDALALLEARPEDRVLVVTHGHFLRYLVGTAIFGDAFSPDHARALRWGIRTNNTGVTILQYDTSDKKRRGWFLNVWNDHAHL